MTDGEYREGQTATNPKTGQRLVYRGGQWRALSVPAWAGGVNGSVPQPRKLTNPEQKSIGDMRNSAISQRESAMAAQKGAAIAKRLHTGPLRGRILEMGIPEPTAPGGGQSWFDSLLDNAGAAVVGTVAKGLGYITNKDVTDYQDLQRLRMTGVQSELATQKGVQAKDDAFRALLQNIAPTGTVQGNQNVATDMDAKATRREEMTNFMTQWTNKYGLDGVDEQGRSMLQAFTQSKGLPQGQRRGPTIRRID